MKKNTIIFVHGAWHGKWCWDKYFRKLFEDQNYEVITFDLPGHDKSGKIKGINKYRLKDYTEALKQEVAKLDQEPIIIGHSMGGLVIQKYLETHTCKKAVLLASIPSYGAIGATLKFARKGYFYPSVLSFNLYGLINSETKSQAAFFSDTLPKSELEEYAANMCSESFLAFMAMLLPRVKVKPHSNMPMLVVGAKNDTIFSPKEHASTAKKFKADLLIIDDIAHDLMLDTKHEEVARVVIDWLDKV